MNGIEHRREAPGAQLTLLAEVRARLNNALEIERKAAHAFAALNGWEWSAKPFSIHRLLPPRPDFFDQAHPAIQTTFLDHSLWFREAERPAAIVAQPYRYPAFEVDVQRFRKRWAVHIPPAAYASIHYPGACRFIVLTRPGVEVQWLPEQDEEFGRFAIHESEWGT